MAPPTKKAKKEHVPTGDDLEDNFVLDDEFAAGDASDSDNPLDGPVADLSDDAGAVAGSDDDEAPRAAGTKRAAGSDEADEAADPPQSKRAAKKANQRKKAKLAEVGTDDRDQDDTALLPVEALADRLAEKQRRALPNLSALELDEQRISRASPRV